jgi:hypothetical protein
MLPKTEFARLVSEMPGASDEEILKAAKDLEAQKDKENESGLEKAWRVANEPMTDAPSRMGTKAADAINNSSRTLELVKRLPAPLAKIAAQVEGFNAGATKGVGDVLSSLTSPLNVGLTLLGVGGAKAGAQGMLGVSRAARLAEGALQAPMVVEGAKNVIEGAREGDYGKAGAGVLEAAGGAAGVHGAFKHSFPVQKVAEGYAKQAGIPKERVAPHEPVKVNPEEAKAVADAYQAMPHNPQDPEVAASYDKLAKEIEDQFGFITQKAGVKMLPWKKEGQPYANSAEMLADIKDNNRLFYFPTEGGFGAEGVPNSDHPMLKVSQRFGVPINDLFRAVHDYFGHGKQGFQFGPSGEENAWLAHKGTLSDEAIPALTSETRGQNSWVNSGPHLRQPDGSIPSKGQPGFVPASERPFAEQKAGLLPAEFHRRQSDVVSQSSPAAQAAEGSLQVPGRSVEGSGPTQPAPSESQIQGASPSHPVYGLADAASTVADLTRRNDGASFNLYKGDLFGTPHYAVSVYPERGEIVPGKASPEVIAKFVEKNQDLLQDPKNSIGTWFNKQDGKTYLDISVTTPDIKEAATLGKAKKQLAIFDLGKGEEISLQPHPASEFTPVGEEPEVTRPQFKDPMQGIQDKIAAQGGRDLQRVAKEQAKRGVTPGLSTALAVAAPAASAAIPDDPDSQLDDYGRLGLNILGAAGLIGAAVRGRQVRNLSPMEDAAHKGAAALWYGGKKAWAQAVGEHANPTLYQASQKILDRHLNTTMNELPKTKKLLALNKAGAADHEWYDQTEQELHKMFGNDAPLVAKFFAATSNNATVASNASLTMKALRQYKMGEPFTGYLPAVIENLKLAAEGKPLNGRKIDNFAKALSGDPEAVVVDRWIMRAFGFNKGTAPTDLQYDFMENAIKKLAADQNMTPRQLQAAIWFGFKNAAEKGKNRPPSPPPAAAMQHSIDTQHGKALVENRKLDKAKAQGPTLPF